MWRREEAGGKIGYWKRWSDSIASQAQRGLPQGLSMAMALLALLGLAFNGLVADASQWVESQVLSVSCVPSGYRKQMLALLPVTLSSVRCTVVSVQIPCRIMYPCRYKIVRGRESSSR